MEVIPRFKCTNCEIAFFQHLTHLRRHYDDCISLQKIRNEVSDLKGMMVQLTSTVAGLVDLTNQQWAAWKESLPRRPKRRRVGDDTSSMVSSATLPFEVQWNQSLMFFRKKTATFPVKPSFLLEIEELLNRHWGPPEITFEQFQQSVQHESQFIHSLFADFAEFIESKKSSTTTRPSDNLGDIFQNVGIATNDLTSLTQMSGENHLLLTKLLFFFQEGFRSYQHKFPMLIFDLGKRKILKLSEKLFLPPPEGNLDEDESFYFQVTMDDPDNIPCFPFFVYPNEEEGWKVMHFTNHVYPVFHALSAALIYKGGAESELIMTQQETRATQTMQGAGYSNAARHRAATMAERQLLDKLNLTTILQQTVLTFMTQFRKKYFEAFLQKLYEEHATTMTTLMRFQQQQPSQAPDQDCPDSPILPDLEESDAVEKPKKKVLVYDPDDQLVDDEEEEEEES